ncbi:hypothetical protein K450DRAFT_191830 [Umbelopsis ramanniana AG]|uniref:Acid phosphatase n=1 Tax=Umbelopsis ramanniana AG TaxID=1314678 RepID=A0AAD5E5D3_UMBRA|nr:uncharacterized protein K450DRAFT_191830 [Umbelopsis ramanniana AG]KAI8577047.1 hypothetical protein K450DRAFT_191830 [Umbelopsis ramanniana AG]
MVVVLENEDYSAVMKNTYMSGLAAAHNGTLLTNYLAVTHPSQPNYIAMIGGATLGFSSDSDGTTSSSSIVDLLEPAGITWKEYAENYTPLSGGGCDTSSSQASGLYRRKHNPFISFTKVTSSAARCANIVPATQLQTDISSGNLPQFMFYTPNMNNDGHDTSLTTAATWLKGFIEPLLANTAFNKRTAVLLTWDESLSTSGNDQVWSVLVGTGVVPQAKNVDSTAYNHYSILATVEKNWGLGNLGQKDATATAFKL